MFESYICIKNAANFFVSELVQQEKGQFLSCNKAEDTEYSDSLY